MNPAAVRDPLPLPAIYCREIGIGLRCNCMNPGYIKSVGILEKSIVKLPSPYYEKLLLGFFCTLYESLQIGTLFKRGIAARLYG